MAGPSSSPDDFTIQLAEWALDQLKTFDSLVMVYDRFAALLSQAAPQQPGENNLHAHFGQLIFTKATQSTNPPVDLCVRLCCLLSTDIGHDLDPPGIPAHIHDYVYRCCMASLKPSGSIQTADILEPRTEHKLALPMRSGETSAPNTQEHALPNYTSLLVSELYNSGLASSANVYEYLQHLAESPVQIDTRIDGICTLFETHGMNLELWEGDKDSVFQWVKDVIMKYPVTEHIKNRVEAIVASLPCGNGSAAQPLPQWQVMVKCQVETLLEMLEGPESDFSWISAQIIERINNAREEHGARTLEQIVEIVFEKAVENEERSEVYARLCRGISEHISPKVQAETVLDACGQPICGGTLFRKYLLNLCQEGFKRAWDAEEINPTLNKLNTYPTNSRETSGERRTMTKRQGAGLTRFLGELFKLEMLTERTMHECIKKLLSDAANPKDEDIESLCKLLTAVGQSLDNPKERNHMDIYFERMQEIARGHSINSRMRPMLLNVIGLRRQWRAAEMQPQTVSSNRGQRGRGRGARYGVQRGGFRPGERRDTTGLDGWNISGSSARPPARASGLSQFGKISESADLQPGPSSVSVASRNLFAFINDDEGPLPGERPRNSPRAGWGFGSSGSPAAPMAGSVRRKLDLLPRSKPIMAGRAEGMWGEREGGAMSEEKARAKVAEGVNEYLDLKNTDEAIKALEALPAYHRHLFVHRLVSAALTRESDKETVTLAEKLLEAAHKREAISPRDFERGLLPTVRFAENMSIDVPRTYEWLARFILAAGLGWSKAEELAGKIRVEGARRIPPKELLMRAYRKVVSVPE